MNKKRKKPLRKNFALFSIANLITWPLLSASCGTETNLIIPKTELEKIQLIKKQLGTINKSSLYENQFKKMKIRTTSELKKTFNKLAINSNLKTYGVKLKLEKKEYSNEIIFYTTNETKKLFFTKVAINNFATPPEEDKLKIIKNEFFSNNITTLKRAEFETIVVNEQTSFDELSEVLGIKKEWFTFWNFTIQIVFKERNKIRYQIMDGNEVKSTFDVVYDEFDYENQKTENLKNLLLTIHKSNLGIKEFAEIRIYDEISIDKAFKILQIDINQIDLSDFDDYTILVKKTDNFLVSYHIKKVEKEEIAQEKVFLNQFRFFNVKKTSINNVLEQLYLIKYTSLFEDKFKAIRYKNEVNFKDVASNLGIDISNFDFNNLDIKLIKIEDEWIIFSIIYPLDKSEIKAAIKITEYNSQDLIDVKNAFNDISKRLEYSDLGQISFNNSSFKNINLSNLKINYEFTDLKDFTVPENMNFLFSKESKTNYLKMSIEKNSVKKEWYLEVKNFNQTKTHIENVGEYLKSINETRLTEHFFSVRILDSWTSFNDTKNILLLEAPTPTVDISNVDIFVKKEAGSILLHYRVTYKNISMDFYNTPTKFFSQDLYDVLVAKRRLENIVHSNLSANDFSNEVIGSYVSFEEAKRTLQIDNNWLPENGVQVKVQKGKGYTVQYKISKNSEVRIIDVNFIYN